ncbi:MAG: sugar kinase [Clostridia bacterium]|nr:sugar kinase [Clostridia bacterium]
MADIWTMGELLVEIMRPSAGISLDKPDYFRGPFPSGAPAIFIDCAARMGAKCGIIGAVGDDDFGLCLTRRLSRDGVDISHVDTVRGISTGCAFVTYFDDGSRKFIFHIGNAACGAARSPSDGCEKGAKYLHICGCSLSASERMGEEILATALKFLDAGAKISFDPNIRPELMRDDSSKAVIDDVVRNSSVILPGVGELLLITGCQSVDSALDKLFRNPKLEVVAVKDGKRGCRIVSGSEDFTMGIYPIEVLDSTGAGDCFDAAMVFGLNSGLSLKECARIATAASALGVNGFGPMEGDISPENIEKLIRENEDV